jgi:crossover junction endodeoxyribonuclease ruvC
MNGIATEGAGVSMRGNLEYDRIIMGIDPGTNVMGYGVLGVKGKQPSVIIMGVIQLSKFESHYMRLSRIFERVTGLVEQYLPDEVAIEAPFFGKNVQSMLKLGRAQGVAMAAVISRDIPITEYAPLSIKQSVTGSGSASKEQVANMLRHILKIPQENMPKLLDATDALAAALAHFYETGKPKVEKGAKSWEQFLRQNPDRIAPRRK